MDEIIKKRQSIFEGVTGYHWLIVIIASCGWLFDCMDQRIFVLARQQALTEVLGSDAAAQAAIGKFIGWATTAMILGWATGGIFFGMMSDKVGRVKTMVATLIVYSGFTGLSGCAVTEYDFILYRFLVGLGVGGMFGAATTLVAESVPSGFRSVALGTLQALSALGNMLGSYISLHIPPGAEKFLWGFSGWRVLFFVGVLPALLIVPILTVLREPEAWIKKKEETGTGKTKMGSPRDLIDHPRWRKNLFVGLALGLAGMVGLWGIGFFSPELITVALSDTPLHLEDMEKPGDIVMKLKRADDPLAKHLKENLPLSDEVRTLMQEYDGTGEPPERLQKALVEAFNKIIEGPPLYSEERVQHLTLSKSANAVAVQNPQDGESLLLLNRLLIETEFKGSMAGIREYVDSVRSKGTLLQDVGSFLGMFAFTIFATYVGRRFAFLWAFVLCLVITMFVFYSLETETQAYWMLPLMGFAQLSVFGGYSIYFPELFPTRLRGTGVSFCYNTVRYLAAPGPLLFGYLMTVISIRTAAVAMSFIYVIGMIALIWAPETKDEDLPEE